MSLSVFIVEKPRCTGPDDMVRSLDEGSPAVPATWTDLFLAQWSGRERPAVVTASETWTGPELVARARAIGDWFAELVPAEQAVPALVAGSPLGVALAAGGALSGRPLAPLGVRLAVPDLVAAVRGLGTPVLVADPDHEDLARQVADASGATVHVLEEVPPTRPATERARQGRDLSQAEVAPSTGSGPATDRARQRRDLSQADAAPSGAVSVVHTSGTTGAPKPVRASQAAMAARLRVYDGVMPIGPGDRFCTASPFHHTAGINMVLTALGRGATVLPMGWFDIDAWAGLGDLGVTHALLVPTMIDRLLGLGRLGDARPRVLQYGAAPIHPRTLREALAALPDAELLQVYGQTEMSPITQLTHADHLRALDHRPDLLGSVGRAAPETTIRLADEGPDGVGELVVAGPHQLASEPGAERATGDLARIDSDGYVTLVGRVEDRIVWAGENIYPAEVEAALSSHPDVREVAVVGVPDRRYGEVVRAVIVPVDPSAPPGVEELRAHAADRLARFKVPAEYELVAALPRNPAGKVLRRALLDG
jgi:acyl-CoA synthetase (AMP-forming)/AMP-acid ligase II